MLTRYVAQEIHSPSWRLFFSRSLLTSSNHWKPSSIIILVTGWGTGYEWLILRGVIWKTSSCDMVISGYIVQHCIFVPFLLDLGCYDNFNLKRKNTVECLCMFHGGQMFSVVDHGLWSYDTHSPRWCMVYSRETQPIWRWCFSGTYMEMLVFLSFSYKTRNAFRDFGPTSHRVEYNLLSNGRCNFWFVRFKWWLINAWSIKQHV